MSWIFLDVNSEPVRIISDLNGSAGGGEWGDLAKMGQMATAAGGGNHEKADAGSFMSR